MTRAVLRLGLGEQIERADIEDRQRILFFERNG
jgi:hypothetical protein